MLKAQEINWSKYCIDIEDVMTLSSLSLEIIRNNFFDDNTFHINIPNRNQDIFIRRSYYGGHVDVYKPYGENLYYYDVNSLYPFIMKSYPIPCAIPVWKKNLKSVGLDSLFGFIDACVVCPTNISCPFLPYKDQSELKFARDLCYRVIPLRGYLFEKKSSPFEGCISNLYKSRLEAKKASDEAMTFIYKILMNSLYGRLGMNPEITYISNNSLAEDDDWKPPKMSVVQLSAAITACARIHMYPYISRQDSYYTDTDSIVLGSSLPENNISSIELAPKSYMLDIEDDRHIIKHKGPAKELLTSKWFKDILADQSLRDQIPTIANFRIDWKKLQIGRKVILIKLGLPQSTKRDMFYDSNNIWIDTRPIDVIDLGNQDANTILKYELFNKNKESVRDASRHFKNP
ncbi:DNA polymerase-like [Mercurialis annua]|uniref:DNA polymerase-like n=1 Tax=Mercurialis annua TaxID=3986 RepID=UPI00215FF666|nr:DNA polymerase-like [Mercurialis annua]